MFIGPIHSLSSSPSRPDDRVVDEAEGPRLRAVAVDRERDRRSTRLRQEVRHDSPVTGLEKGTVRVEDPRDLRVDTVHAVVGHRERLGEALRLVVHRAQPDRVHVAPVVLALGVLLGVAVHLARRRQQEASAVRARASSSAWRVPGRADGQRLERTREVLGRARRAREVQHGIDRTARPGCPR